MKGLNDKIANMNPRKGFCTFILCFIIFFIAAGVGTIAKFGGRASEIKQQVKTIENMKEQSDHHAKKQEYNKGDGEDNENSQEQDSEKGHDIDWENVISLKTSDYVFLGCVIAVFWIILSIYWLYTLAYAVSKSWEVAAL